MKRKQNKTSLLKTISSLLLIIAILLLNYPLISDSLTQKNSTASYTKYINTVSKLSDYDSLEAAADGYNEHIALTPDRFNSEKESKIYPEILNIQNGIMAYITAEKAGIINVPVYHYTTAETLQVGAGHLAGSSVPSDKLNVHTVISGHSGMSEMKMFSKLPDMNTGDKFEVKYLNKVLIYQVDHIEKVLPDDTSSLYIDPYENYCSLITCTPIGLNTHRLIVRGKLIKTEIINEENAERYVYNDNKVGITNRFAKYELIMSGISFILFIILIKDIIKSFKNKKKNKKEIQRRDPIEEYPIEIPFDKL